jgi:hypothetical protein
MKERPMLFSGEMVRAIIEGRKTQTRRVINSQVNLWHISKLLADCGLSGSPQHIKGNEWRCEVQTEVDDSAWDYFKCPFGVIGDRLYVREAYYNDCTPFDGTEREIAKVMNLENGYMYYRADGDPKFESGEDVPWKPSIHMPKWASRIMLQITDIRTERMQDGGDREFWGEEQWALNPWVWVIEFKRV